MTNYYDIVIIGGGPVGICMALALAKLPLRIALLEANPSLVTPPANVNKIDSDGRSLALTYQSSLILQELGIWPTLATQTTPIAKVHISDRGHFGMTRITAREEKVPALGYVIPAVTLGIELNKAIAQCANIRLWHSAKVQSLEYIAPVWQLDVSTSHADPLQVLQAGLVIAADGTHSTIRQLLAIKTTFKDYQQSAIATTVTLARSHQNIAYERFMTTGALAMLPRAGLSCGCVWTGSSEMIKNLQALSDQDFLQQVQQQFGYRLGSLLAVGARHVYPLKMQTTTQLIRPGLVFIGNAAQTLHPIAAQGFNLGLGDVARLATTIQLAVEQRQNPGDLTTLENYLASRQEQVKWILKFTDKLTHLFSHDFLPLNLLRSTSLLALDLIPALKHRLASRLMGK